MRANLKPVICPDHKCHKILFERHEGWRGEPIEIICKKCGKRVEVTEAGARFVE